jgi:hypothetical protein
VWASPCRGWRPCLGSRRRRGEWARKKRPLLPTTGSELLIHFTHPLTHPPRRRSRYAGLKALLPILGPHELLARCPTLIPSSLAAVTAGGNTAPPATRLLLLVLRSLMPGTTPGAAGSQKKKKRDREKAKGRGEEKKEEEKAEEVEGVNRNDETVAAVRALWLRPVAQALLHPYRPARTRVADHLLQELMALDPPASLALLSEIRALSSQQDTGHSHSHGHSHGSLGDTALWALLSVAEVARALGGVGPALTASLQILPAAPRAATSTPMVTLEEARRAGLCGDCDVRYAALRMAVASSKTTTLPTEGEQALVEEVGEGGTGWTRVNTHHEPRYLSAFSLTLTTIHHLTTQHNTTRCSPSLSRPRSRDSAMASCGRSVPSLHATTRRCAFTNSKKRRRGRGAKMWRGQRRSGQSPRLRGFCARCVYDDNDVVCGCG